MNKAAARAHFADVVRWSNEARFERRRVLLSVLATALPIGAGLWSAHPALGYVVALGAVLMAGEPATSPGEHHSLAMAVLPAVAAVIVAGGIAHLPGAEAIMIALVACAATLVNYSRPAAVAGVRFIVFLVLNLGLIGAHGAHGRGAALMFGIGALWRTALRMLARRGRTHTAADTAPNAPPARTPTPRQRRIHLRRMLATLAGWQYPLRLALGLAAACALRDLWPRHHYDWIVLSVVLMTPRVVEHLPVAITQRALGTLAGVLLAGALLHAGLPHGALALLVCVFGALAPLARSGNYAAYCALSTPLILLALSASGPVADGLLVDRLVATLAGSAIVAVANLALDAALRRAASSPKSP